MSNKLKNVQEFDPYLTSLIHELRDANDHFHFVDCLREAIVDYEREINCSPTFWSYTIDAHVSAVLSHLCRIFDDHPAAVHLIFLLETVRDNPDVFSKQALRQRLGQRVACDDLVEHFGDPDKAKIEAGIAFCRDASTTVRKLREWRNNVVSHLNKRASFDFDSFKNRWPLEQKDIQELIEKGHEIINWCAGWYGAGSVSLFLPSDKDYKFVLESVRLNLSKRDERDDLLAKIVSSQIARPGV